MTLLMLISRSLRYAPVRETKMKRAPTIGMIARGLGENFWKACFETVTRDFSSSYMIIVAGTMTIKMKPWGDLARFMISPTNGMDKITRPTMSFCNRWLVSNDLLASPAV